MAKSKKTTTTTTSTLADAFQNANKLVELKEVAAAFECFADLDLDSYAGLQGPKQLKADMLEAMPDDVRQQIQAAPKAEKPAKAAKPAKQKKEPRQPSPFGTGVDLMCKNPDMKLAQLRTEVAAAGFDPEKSKSAITTAYSSVRKIAGLLEANGWTRP